MTSIPPGTVGRPIPAGRGRWRLTVHNRQFVNDPNAWATTMVAQLGSARSRRLVQAWDSPAQLTFTIDGRDPAAAVITELQTDVMAWRWDDQPGATYGTNYGCDVPVFRGVVTQTEDEITEQSHVVNVVCTDYLAMMARRIYTVPASFTQQDQDALVASFVSTSVAPASASGQTFAPGGYLPLVSVLANPDGTPRSLASGQVRDRSYPAGVDMLTNLDDLAKVINGFDYDVVPYRQAVDSGLSLTANGRDVLRVFYPYQGVQRFDVPLVYPSTIAAATRAISSGDYANFWRVIGNSPSGSPDGTPPMFSEAWNPDTNNVTVIPVGLWMQTDNAADVNLQPTLDQKAQGDLALAGVVHANLTLTFRPGAYRWGAPNMGDICPVVISSGRLSINDNIRVLGLAYAIGDDGDEDVEVTVGRPARTLTELLTQADKDADALTRR